MSKREIDAHNQMKQQHNRLVYRMRENDTIYLSVNGAARDQKLRMGCQYCVSFVSFAWHIQCWKMFVSANFICSSPLRYSFFSAQDIKDDNDDDYDDGDDDARLYRLFHYTLTLHCIQAREKNVFIADILPLEAITLKLACSSKKMWTGDIYRDKERGRERDRERRRWWWWE